MSQFTAPNFTGITYADLNKAFNTNSVLQNIKLKWIAVYILNVDGSSGGTLRMEVSNSYLQDALDSSNVTTYDDQGTTGRPPRILIKIPPNQQVSRKGSDTTNLCYFAYLFSSAPPATNVTFTLRAGIVGRV